MSTTEPAAATVPYEACALTTDRLTLSPMDLDTATQAHSPFATSKAVNKYLRWEVRDHDEDMTGRLTKRLAKSAIKKPGDGLVWAVQLNDGDGVPGGEIGDVSLFAKSIRNAQFEIGWVFHPAIHGRGFATEATTKVLDLAFDTLGAHRVFAELDSLNEASARLCGILGMRREALLLGREIVDGAWHDVAIYAITAEEWAARER